MEKLQKHSDEGDKGEKSRENLMGSNGNRRGSKRKVGRPKNKMKKIDDLVKQTEEIVTDSGANIQDVYQKDQRSVLDLDEIVREHMKKISELGGKEICIVSSDDDDDDDQSIGHERDKKETKGQQCKEHEEYFQEEARRKSAIEKDDEENLRQQGKRRESDSRS